nr:hypothetical protein [Helicobacter pylori]
MHSPTLAIKLGERLKRSAFSLSSASILANRENRGFVRGFDGMTCPN